MRAWRLRVPGDIIVVSEEVCRDYAKVVAVGLVQEARLDE